MGKSGEFRVIWALLTGGKIVRSQKLFPVELRARDPNIHPEAAQNKVESPFFDLYHWLSIMR